MKYTIHLEDEFLAELQLTIEVESEDIGIGHWECHGSGYHSDVVATWDGGDIEIEQVESKLVFSKYTIDGCRNYSNELTAIRSFDFKKLNKRNQNKIKELINCHMENNDLVSEIEEYYEDERISYMEG
jgi:hypothetical protein